MSTIWTELLGERFCVAYHDIDGVRTRCLEAGQGPPLLLLHGRGGHLESWSKNIVALSRNFRVIALDMLGHGFTEKPAIDYTIEKYAAHLRAVIRIGALDRVCIVGQSLGGWVGAWLARQEPNLVDKLVLVNTNGFREIPADVVNKIRQNSLAAVDCPTFESIHKRLQPLFFDSALITQELVNIRLKIYRQADMKHATELIVGSELEPENQKRFQLTPEVLKSIATPTLVIWSTHDPLLSWNDAKQCQQGLPNSWFHLIEDCAHWPQFEKPEEFNNVVSRFLLGN